MSSRSRVHAWIAVCLLVPSAGAGQEQTEREVVELIVRDGPQARAIRSETEVTRREQLARLAYPNPSLTYSREGAGFTEFLQAEQPVPVFGARAALSRAGGAATGAAEADRDARLWRLRSDAAAAVSRAVAEQARLEAARAYMRELERLIEILRTREREGEGSRFDRLRAEEEYREANQVVASATAALAEARSVLTGMLPRDVPASTIAAASPSGPMPAIDALSARAIAARAELRALQQTEARAAFEADAARRARLPAPTVFGGLKRADDLSGRARGGVFGVTVSLPVFDRGGREAARWDAERARADAERASLEHRIRSEVAGAAQVLSVRQAAIAAEGQAGAEELVQIAEIAYREGEVGILELLDAVRTAARARNRGIDLRLDVRLAQVALERAIGAPVWP
ncbi:MAG TPA: TolC family protein [Vicinamibacterales bacterium]|nr:TolC family protein [Vicinamibacterales bacterium]